MGSTAVRGCRREKNGTFNLKLLPNVQKAWNTSVFVIASLCIANLVISNWIYQNRAQTSSEPKKKRNNWVASARWQLYRKTMNDKRKDAFLRRPDREQREVKKRTTWSDHQFQTSSRTLTCPLNTRPQTSYPSGPSRENPPRDKIVAMWLIIPHASPWPLASSICH